MRVDATAKIFAAAVGMVLMTGLPAAAQAPSSAHALIGTTMTLQDAGQVGGRAATVAKPSATELTVAESDKREIVAAATAGTKPERVGASPAGSHEESPVSRKDATMPSRGDSCRGNKVGEKRQAVCADQTTAAGVIGPTVPAYDSRRAAQAELHRKALSTPGGREVVNEIFAILDQWDAIRPRRNRR
jgi:hypothetical protein